MILTHYQEKIKIKLHTGAILLSSSTNEIPGFWIVLLSSSNYHFQTNWKCKKKHTIIKLVKGIFRKERCTKNSKERKNWRISQTCFCHIVLLVEAQSTSAGLFGSKNCSPGKNGESDLYMGWLFSVENLGAISKFSQYFKYSLDIEILQG